MGGQQGMTPSSAAAFPMLLSGGQQPSLDGVLKLLFLHKNLGFHKIFRIFYIVYV
jgi:hypothetical protein